MLGAEKTPTQMSPGRLARTGRVVTCPIDDTLLLVIGAGGAVAGELPAEVNDDPDTASTASVIGWRLPAPLASATHGFAALLPMSNTNRPLTAIRFGREGAGRRHVLAPRTVSVGDAAEILAELAGGQVGSTLDALVDILMQGLVGRRRLQTIITLLRSARASDGFIELVGESHDGAIFIRGWGRNVEPGICRALVSGESPAAVECSIACFPREDLVDGAAGFVCLLPVGETLSAPGVEGLFYRGRGAWRYAAVHERRVIAGATETPGHIRSILLQTHSSPKVLLRLRTAANSFDGSETVSTLPLPVRMGIDNVFQVNDGGFLISGWLIDPEDHVDRVKLARGRHLVRLDDRWTRLDRSDVTDAFTDEPIFRGTLERNSHSHGFIVFADGLGGDASAPLHLELTLRDCRRAFMPLKTIRTSPRLGALRQIGSIDPVDWALQEIVDRHIAPFLCASENPRPTAGAIVDAGPFDRAPGPPIIIAAAGAEQEDIAPFLGLLALDRETRCAPIALVLPAERFRRQAARVEVLAQFYRLSLRLISAEETGDVYDLLEAGVRALTHDTVVLLTDSLLPHRIGWYGKLVSAHQTLKAAIISPTLAYEDHSVRWAGNRLEDGCEEALSDRYAGYPLSAVTGLKLTRTAAASFECCIMPREVLLKVGGFSGSYLGTRYKGLDLGLRLSRFGTESYWLPSVQMLGSDEPSSLGTATRRSIIERIDRGIFATRWAPAPAEKEGAAEGCSA